MLSYTRVARKSRFDLTHSGTREFFHLECKIILKKSNSLPPTQTLETKVAFTATPSMLTALHIFAPAPSILKVKFYSFGQSCQDSTSGGTEVKKIPFFRL